MNLATDAYDYATKFRRGDHVYWLTASEKRLHGKVIKRLCANRVLVDDGNGLSKIVISAERLRFDVPSNRPRSGGGAVA